MTTDKELLEKAARAAGYPISDGYFEEATAPNGWWGWAYIDGSGEPPNDSAWTELWNPLTDDGDALRLAVKLGLTINPYQEGVFVSRFAGEEVVAEPFEVIGQPDAPATRRAIVRAAAQGEKR
jgi:hypothetical protein